MLGWYLKKNISITDFHERKNLASPSSLRLLTVDLTSQLDPAVKVLGLSPVRRDLGLEAWVLPQEGLAHVGGVPLGGGVARTLLGVTERHPLRGSEAVAAVGDGVLFDAAPAPRAPAPAPGDRGEYSSKTVLTRRNIHRLRL